MQLLGSIIISVIRVGFGVFLRFRLHSMQSSITERFEGHDAINTDQSSFAWIIGYLRAIFGLLLILLVVILF